MEQSAQTAAVTMSDKAVESTVPEGIKAPRERREEVRSDEGGVGAKQPPANETGNIGPPTGSTAILSDGAHERLITELRGCKRAATRCAVCEQAVSKLRADREAFKARLAAKEAAIRNISDYAADHLKARHDLACELARYREAVDAKWGKQTAPPLEGQTLLEWNAILVEEVGEFSEAVLHNHFGGPKAANTRHEAVQVAVVALATAFREGLYESLHQFGPKPTSG